MKLNRIFLCSLLLLLIPMGGWADGTAYDQAVAAYDAKDYSRAIAGFQAEAVKGNPNAEFSLGVCYDLGNGVPKDPQKAVFWYQQAAGAGVEEAQNNLASCYENGEGVVKDYHQAYYWFRKAAAQGNQKAKENLANLDAYFSQSSGYEQYVIYLWCTLPALVLLGLIIWWKKKKNQPPKTNEPIPEPVWPCPCCGYGTLKSWEDGELCVVCGWEKHGRGRENDIFEGINGSLSLAQARANFLKQGTSGTRADFKGASAANYLRVRRFELDETGHAVEL
jgi:hypothetical protein